MVGMSKSGSRYGRRSNWFKIHCLLQEQQEKQQQQQQNGEGLPLSPSMSPYSFGGSANMFLSSKAQDEDLKTVSTPSTSPASSHVSDTPSTQFDLLSKLRTGQIPSSGLHMGGMAPTPNHQIPKEHPFYMPMATFPGMPFPLPPNQLAQLFFSGFRTPAGIRPPTTPYQDLFLQKPQMPFMNMEQFLLHKQMDEERQRALLNSPPVSVSPQRPLSCEVDVKSPSPRYEEAADMDEVEEEEPASKRQKRDPVCGNHEESSNNDVIVSKTKGSGEEQPLDLSLTKGNNSKSSSGDRTEPEHLPAAMSSAVGGGCSPRQKYKGADCPAQTGEEADSVRVDVDDQRPTAFFDYFKQTFVGGNQFLKIKNNEIYSF